MSGRTPYPGLESITDPTLKRVLKLLYDKVGVVEQATTAIGTVSRPLTAHMDAGSQQIKALADPSAPQDAVTLRYLQHYVESRVHTTVAAALATVPGTPGGPPVAPPPPVVPTGPPTTGALTHGFDLSTATIYNSPMDIASWPVTGAISKVTIGPGNGVYCFCNTVSAQNASPPPLPGEWPQGPSAADAPQIQYTLYVLLQVAGVWAASGIIQYWLGRPGSGSVPVGAEFAANWCYDARFGTLNGQTPPPGTQMGFMVAAGNHRGTAGVTTVRERSEVVLLNLPDANGATYT